MAGRGAASYQVSPLGASAEQARLSQGQQLLPRVLLLFCLDSQDPSCAFGEEKGMLARPATSQVTMNDSHWGNASGRQDQIRGVNSKDPFQRVGVPENKSYKDILLEIEQC